MIRVGDLVEVIDENRNRFTCIVVKYYDARHAFYGRVVDVSSGDLKMSNWVRFSVPRNSGVFVSLDCVVSCVLINRCNVVNVKKSGVFRSVTTEDSDEICSSSQEYILPEEITYRTVRRTYTINNRRRDEYYVFCTIMNGQFGGWAKYTQYKSQESARKVAYDSAVRASKEFKSTLTGFCYE